MTASLPSKESGDRTAIRRDLRQFLEHGATGGYPHESVVNALNEWLDSSTDEEINEMSHALEIVRESETSTDQSLLREAGVIRAILHGNFDNREHLHRVHGILSVRSAFCSPSAITNNYPVSLIPPLYLGFFGADFPMYVVPVYRALSHEQKIAALRFAYEMTFASYSGTGKAESPVMEIFVEIPDPQAPLVRSRFPVLAYRERGMLDLVAENADRVGKLIHLAQDHGINDIKRLTVLLDHDGHSSLSSGSL